MVALRQCIRPLAGLLALTFACAGEAPQPHNLDGSGDNGPDAAAPVAQEADPPAWASPGELATRLAHLIWHGPADATLVRELEAGVSRARVAAVAESMLRDPRARDGVAAFYRWWLFFEGRPFDGAKPLGGAGVDVSATELFGEAPALGTYLTLDTRGTFADLLTAPYTFMNERIASRYGLDDVRGDELKRVPYPAGQPRIGLLTGAGVLSYYSSLVNPSWPAKRGWLVTDAMLCTPIIQSFLPSFTPDPSQSLRAQMTDVTSNGTCQPCHKLLDSPGFPFIGFDSFGRWHPEPGRAPNETQGWIDANILSDRPTFNGPAELAQHLANRAEARRCFVQQWMVYARDPSQRRVETINPPNGLDAVTRAAAQSGFVLRDVILAVVRSDHFLVP